MYRDSRSGLKAAGVNALSLILVAAAHGAVAQVVISAAVWRPPAGFMTGFHAHCDAVRGVAFDACFAAAMEKAGASPAALEFTRLLGNEAYLEALPPTGGAIAVAHVVHPFRANENDAWVLVNGKPPLIDVDERRYLDLAQLWSSPVYAEIRRNYPSITVWPGERGPAGPEIAQDGRAIIVTYLLRDLCHVCAILVVRRDQKIPFRWGVCDDAACARGSVLR